MNLGGTVATVGFPDIGLQGFAPKLAKGEIASLSGAGDDPRYFQIIAPVQPGNSGGALVDDAYAMFVRPEGTMDFRRSAGTGFVGRADQTPCVWLISGCPVGTNAAAKII